MDQPREKWRGRLQAAQNKLFIWLLGAVFMLLGWCGGKLQKQFRRDDFSAVNAQYAVLSIDSRAIKFFTSSFHIFLSLGIFSFISNTVKRIFYRPCLPKSTTPEFYMLYIYVMYRSSCPVQQMQAVKLQFPC